MQEFSGKVAVVTGAASGIGRATATRFCEEGMRVVLADIAADDLNHTVNELQQAGHDAVAVVTDVSKREQVERLADAAMDAYGQVNIVHNNAGVVRAGKLEELTEDDWQWVLGVDLWSVIHGVAAFLPLIKQAGNGHIINTASTAGLQASPNIAPYNVAKFGVVALTETLRIELEEDKCPIGVSVLCPGAVRTQITASERNREATGAPQGADSKTEDAFKNIAGAIVRAGLDPDAVADLIVQAIRNNDFWILTHPDWIKVMQERVTGMQTRELITGFGG